MASSAARRAAAFEGESSLGVRSRSEAYERGVVPEGNIVRIDSPETSTGNIDDDPTGGSGRMECRSQEASPRRHRPLATLRLPSGGGRPNSS